MRTNHMQYSHIVFRSGVTNVGAPLEVALSFKKVSDP